MTRMIWITGRTATGKSTLINELVPVFHHAGVGASVVTDEEILQGLVRADANHVHHIHPRGDERIAFTSGHLFDDGLRLLDQRLHELLRPDDQVSSFRDPLLPNPLTPSVVLVELARGCPGPPIDVSYRRALELLDPALWPRSRVYRLDIPWPQQVARNHRRSLGHPRGPSLQVLQELYSNDDPSPFTDAGIEMTTLPSVPVTDLAQVVLNDYLTTHRRNI